MSKYVIEESTLENIADTIRKVNGETKKYTPAEMAKAISNITDLTLVNRLCPPFEEEGHAVICQPVSGYPLEVVSHLEYKNLIDPVKYAAASNNTTVDGDVFTTDFDTDGLVTNTGGKENYVMYPAGTYTASIIPLTAGLKVAFWIRSVATREDITWKYNVDAANNSFTFTVNEEFLFSIGGMSSTGCGVQSYRLQLERGSTATPYVPHAPFTEVKLTRCGKNLLAYPYVDTTKTVDGMTFTDNGDGSITLNGTSTSPYLSYTLHLETFADALKDGVTYHLSTGTDDTNIAIICYYKNESGASVWASGNMTWKKEYTLSQVYLQVTEVATYTNMVLYPQIEIGTTATAFEPYRGYTYTMDLGQEVYGGHLNWNTGVLTIDWYFEEIDGVNKKFGNRYAWDNIVQYPVTMQYGLSSAVVGNIICSHFVNRNSTADRSCNSYAGGNKDIIVSIYDFATLDEANAWLVEQKNNGTPLTFCYEMYEPITIQLTPQEIIAFSDTNILSSNTGITEVSGRANPIVIIQNLEDRLAALEAVVINNA